MWRISHRTNTDRRGDVVKFKLESRKQKKPVWVNGWRWRLEFNSWGFYQCEVWEEETDEMMADYCNWSGDTRKEYKKHLKEHNANI